MNEILSCEAEGMLLSLQGKALLPILSNIVDRWLVVSNAMLCIFVNVDTLTSSVSSFFFQVIVARAV